MAGRAETGPLWHEQCFEFTITRVMTKLRHHAYIQLMPVAWPHRGFSPVNIIIIGLILASVLLSIIATEHAFKNRYEAMILSLEMCFAILFSIEYLTRLWAVAEADGSESAWQKRWRFAYSPTAIFDLIAIMALLLPLVVESGVLLRLLRLLRIFMLARLGRFSQSMQILGQVLVSRAYELAVTCLLAITLMLISATVLYFAEGAAQPEDFGSIPRALWWSIITLTTVDYGDVSPITPIGKGFASIVAVMGIGLVAMPAGILAAAFSDALQKQRESKAE